ncbi:54S ribosomal protein L27, partial [Trichoderma ghanense]
TNQITTKQEHHLNFEPLSGAIRPFTYDSCHCISPQSTTATMRPTQILGVGKYRHLKLTTKDVGRGFYKGNRTGSMGRHTKYGGYLIEWNKVRTYVVPQNLAESKLTPFVSREVREEPGDYKGLNKGPQDPYFYVEQWKRYNGVD